MPRDPPVTSTRRPASRLTPSPSRRRARPHDRWDTAAARRPHGRAASRAASRRAPAGPRRRIPRSRPEGGATRAVPSRSRSARITGGVAARAPTSVTRSTSLPDAPASSSGARHQRGRMRRPRRARRNPSRAPRPRPTGVRSGFASSTTIPAPSRIGGGLRSESAVGEPTPQVLTARVDAARDHDVGPSICHEVGRVTDGDETGRTAGAQRDRRPAEPARDAHLARGGIGHRRREQARAGGAHAVEGQPPLIRGIGEEAPERGAERRRPRWRAARRPGPGDRRRRAPAPRPPGRAGSPARHASPGSARLPAHGSAPR